MNSESFPLLAGANEHDRAFVTRMIALLEALRSSGKPTPRDVAGELDELRELAERLSIDPHPPGSVNPPQDTHDRHAVSLAIRELEEGGDRRVRGFARRVLASRRGHPAQAPPPGRSDASA
jgi:hypothetical protein